MKQIPSSGFDLYLNIDDGLRYQLPPDLHPSAWWAIDTHLDFAWCRENGVDTVILLDSDCVAPPDFVTLHLAHHHEHPEAIGVGCAIEGTGVGATIATPHAVSSCAGNSATGIF